MAIIGTTDLGRGRYQHTVDHDPSSVATDGLKTSVAHDITTDYIWLKLDDGVTTNWINARDATNIITGPFTTILDGQTTVGGALTVLDDLDLSQVGGGLGGGVFITQHNQGQPFSEASSTNWTTLCAIPYEGNTTWPITTCHAVVSLSNSGEGSVRVQDVTNNQTLTVGNWTMQDQHIISGAVSNVPAGQAVLEIQLAKVSGGKPRLWSLQLQ